MKKLLPIIFALLFAACAQVNLPDGHGGTGHDDQNSVNTVDSVNPASGNFGDANYPTQLYNSLTKERANENTEYQFGNFVYTGTLSTACLGATAAGLTHTPGSCIAYNANYRATETGSITYANNATTWVAMDENTTGNNAGLPNFTRVGSTHYLTDAIDANQPAMVSDSQLLMKVVTAGGAITAVTDLRNTAPSVTNSSASGVLYCSRMKCDGSTDDAPALQYCINAATASATTNTTVKMPTGVCKLNSAVSYTGITPFTLQGATNPTGQVSAGAAGTVLQADTGLTTQVLTFTEGASPLQGMVLRDFTIDCNSNATNGIKIADHGLDYSNVVNVEVKGCTGDGVLAASGGHIINATFTNLQSHNNTNRGLFLQGTLNNLSFINSKFFYNYQAGGGFQVQCGTGSSRTGPVTFVNSDMEPFPSDIGTDIDYQSGGCLTTFVNPYFETHGAATSTGISIANNGTGETWETNVIGGFSSTTTSNFFFSPGSGTGGTPGNIVLNVMGMHLKGYLCGGACTSSRTNPASTAPISGLSNADMFFTSQGNDWFPDVQAGRAALENGAMTGRANWDEIWPDATAHRWKVNNNNVGALNVETYNVGVIGSAPTCNAAQEGTFYTATDCNAGCSAGGTCTTGAATHCGLYCNGSAWKETGI